MAEIAVLVTRAQLALGTSQRGLGELFGLSKRTIARWEHGHSTVGDENLGQLAVLVYPHDRALAAEIAKAAHKTFVELGLEPAPVVVPKQTATHAHLVDSIVCAAAEAVDSTPKQVRPIVMAAFARSEAVGLDVHEVNEVLRPPAKKK
jgi:transcriptional regulator with XRE-family HTH domain